MYQGDGIGQRGEVGAEHRLERTRVCHGCRATLLVNVLGKGEARYHHGAAAQARTDAEQAARADAALLSGLAACPRCGAREGVAVRQVIFHALIRLCAAAAVVAVAWWSEIPPAKFVAVLAAWALFVSHVAVNIRRFVGAKRRVEITLSEADAPARVFATPVVETKLEMR
jgi:hypothetical protein